MDFFQFHLSTVTSNFFNIMINTARCNNNQEREHSNTNEIEHYNPSQSDCVKIVSIILLSKTMRYHRNRIKEIIEFVEMKYPS